MINKIKEIIKASMNKMNQIKDEKIWDDINEESILSGEGSKLDSMDFVNFIVIVEEGVFEEFNKTITIVNEKAFSLKYNPFKTVNRLSEYIKELLDKAI